MCKNSYLLEFDASCILKNFSSLLISFFKCIIFKRVMFLGII